MTVNVPQLMPVLSRLSHQRPEDGACIMEMASYLAGEEWSDYPKCVNLDLATLAQHLNDNARTDDERRELLPLLGDFMSTGSVTTLRSQWPMHLLVQFRRIEDKLFPYSLGSKVISYTAIVEDLAKLLDDFREHFLLGERVISDEEIADLAQLTGAGV